MKLSHVLALALGAASVAVAVAQDEAAGPLSEGEDMDMPMEAEGMAGSPDMVADGPEETDMMPDGAAPPGTRGLPAGPIAPPTPCATIADSLADTPATAALADVITTSPDILANTFPDLLGDLTDPAADLTVCVPPGGEVGKLVSLLSTDPSVTADDIGDVIALHIAQGAVFAETFLSLPYGSIIPTFGGNLTLYNSDDTVMLGTGVVNVTVIKPDTVPCAEGSVVHELDGLLIPPGSSITPEKIAQATAVPLLPDGSLAPTPALVAPPGTRGLGPVEAAAPGDAADAPADGSIALWAVPSAVLALAATALAL